MTARRPWLLLLFGAASCQCGALGKGDVFRCDAGWCDANGNPVSVGGSNGTTGAATSTGGATTTTSSTTTGGSTSNSTTSSSGGETGASGSSGGATTNGGTTTTSSSTTGGGPASSSTSGGATTTSSSGGEGSTGGSTGSSSSSGTSGGATTTSSSSSTGGTTGAASSTSSSSTSSSGGTSSGGATSSSSGSATATSSGGSTGSSTSGGGSSSGGGTTSGGSTSGGSPCLTPAPCSIGQTQCDPNEGAWVESCVFVDGGCPDWQWSQRTDCASQSLVCGTASGSAACQCAPNGGTTVFADSIDGSPVDAGVYATGLEQPPNCRVGTLTQALALAGPGLETVEAYGAQGQASGQMTFSTSTGEVFPLSIPANVTLTTSTEQGVACNGTCTYTIVSNGPTGGVIRLHDSSAIAGFTIENQGTDSSSDGLTCYGTGASVSDCTVQGPGGGSAAGFHASASGNCGSVQLSNVTIEGFGGSGLSIAAAGADVVGSVVTLAGNGEGIYCTAGTVNLNGVDITGNDRHAVDAPSASNVSITIDGGTIGSNGGSTACGGGPCDEVLVEGTGTFGTAALTLIDATIPNSFSAGVVASKGASATLADVTISNCSGTGLGLVGPGLFVVTGCTVSDNGLGAGTGVFLDGSGAGSRFTGNVVCGNANGGDQIVVDGGSWNLSGSDCMPPMMGMDGGGGANVITGYAGAMMIGMDGGGGDGGGGGGVGLNVVNGKATADDDIWENGFPQPGLDYSGNVTSANGCGFSMQSCP